MRKRQREGALKLAVTPGAAQARGWLGECEETCVTMRKRQREGALKLAVTPTSAPRRPQQHHQPAADASQPRK